MKKQKYNLDEIKNKILQGNVLDVLKRIPDESVDCIVTSPPYWGLRDYGKETNIVWSGNKNCEHEFETIKSSFCKKCGAWYGQLGLEPTLDLYIEHMLQITVELKRVLKKTGVMFWNHGDCYGGVKIGKTDKKVSDYIKDSQKNLKKYAPKYEKCMMLQNYRTIIRMIDEQGWILRNTIIWYKPNHMPSSVKDRFATAYEPVFMLTKNKKYWFDLDAVRVPYKIGPMPFNLRVRDSKKGKGPQYYATEAEYRAYIRKNKKYEGKNASQNTIIPNPKKGGKNPGDVWKIPTQPFPEAHFAVYPEKLVEPMIKAGCPKNGIVLDPFMGSGTTAVVSRKLGRKYIGIELNPEYIKIAEKRLQQQVLL